MISNQKIKEISNQNKEKVSLWLFVTKNIMKETNIIDYDLNNYNPECFWDMWHYLKDNFDS